MFDDSVQTAEEYDRKTTYTMTFSVPKYIYSTYVEL